MDDDRSELEGVHPFHSEPTLTKLIMMDDPLDDFKMSIIMASEELCDKSEGLSQLYKLSIVEPVDLFK